MKKNLIKAFLSLWVLALVAASGMTIAQETYEVTIGNMNGYWRLNLGRLIMRNSGGSEWIILDWAYSQSDYVIKIWPNLATGNNLSKLRVTNICDNKWNNCKKVSDLSTWIKINGTGGLVCIKINDKEINCNQALWAWEITIMQWWISKWSFNVNTNSAKTIELSWAIALEWTNSRFCTKKDDNTILCNVATGAILNVSVPNPVPELSRGSTTTIGSVWWTVFKVTTPANPHKAWRNVVANTENGTVAGATDNTNTYLNYAEGSDAKSHIQIQWATVSAENNVITITSSTNGWGGDHITWQNIVGQYSNSTTNNPSVSFNPYINHVENSQVTSSILIKWSGATTVERSNNVITISSTAGDGSSGYTLPNATTTTLWWVKLWSDTKQTTSANNVSSTASRTYAIQVDNNNGRLVVNVPRTDNNTTYTAGTGLSLASNVFKASLKNETKSSYQATNNIGNVSRSDRLYAVGMDKDGYLAVHVPRTDTAWWWDTIWSTGNQTLIGDYITPKDAKAIYFGNKTATTIYYWTVLGSPTLKFQRYWLNASTSPVEFNAMWAKFWVDSSLARTSSIGWVSIAWELLVWRNSSKSNWIRVYSTWDNYSNPNWRHGEIRASNELAVWIMDWAFIYFKNIPNTSNNDLQKYRVWINTDSPATTLDVAWSIRVQDNPCVPNSCSEDTVWSITFINNKFYWCKKKSTNVYRWYEFTMTESDSAELVSSLVCQSQAAY